MKGTWKKQPCFQITSAQLLKVHTKTEYLEMNSLQYNHAFVPLGKPSGVPGGVAFNFIFFVLIFFPA